MKRAACYCRVSTLTQAKEGYSLEWQQTNLPILAHKAGGTVTDDDIFVEVMSGAKDDRPEYNKLMARIMEGYYQEVWVVEKSRLSRTEDRAEEQRIVEALQKFGCVIKTPGATFDVSTLEGEFFNDIDSAVNRMERKRIKYRLINGKVTKLKSGGYTGGSVPTGYKIAHRDLSTGKLTFDFDPQKAKLVRHVFDYALSGMSAWYIAEILYKEGYRSRNNTRITNSTVLKWLKNPHYAGYTQWGHGTGSKAKKMIVDQNDYLPPLVTKEEFQNVQNQLSARKIRFDKREKQPLSGILRCSNCGYKMGAEVTRRYPVYCCNSKSTGNRCVGEKSKTIPRSTAHQLFIEVLPGLIKFIQQKAPFVKGRVTIKPTEDNNRERLEAHKEVLKTKIMNNIKQQEDNYSEFRKQRILELEQEYDKTQKELEELQEPPSVIQLPNVHDIQELIPEISVDDTELLRMIATELTSKIHYRQSSHKYSGKYEITRIFTPWGDVYKVKSNKHVYFERFWPGF